ncbi:Putative ammonia monooxygenase [uncultured Blautia sp.]|nr:Putative ammonia monooxygenase [uncultured Blautia sp.]
MRTGNAWLPKRLKLTAQCLAGVNIGVTITLAELLTFRELLLPAAAVAVNCVMVNYLLGFLIHKTCGLDLPTIKILAA